MRKTTKVLVIFLIVLVAGIGAYFVHEFYAERSEMAEQEQAVMKAGDAETTGPQEEMIRGYPKSELAATINAYRKRCGRDPIDFSDKKIYLDDMSDKRWQEVADMADYKSVKELKREMNYGKGFIASVLVGNVNFGYYLFEDSKTGELRIYVRAFETAL